MLFHLWQPTAELKNSFHFKVYIIVSKVYKVSHLSISLIIEFHIIFSLCLPFILFLDAYVQHKNADQKGKQNSDETIIYVKPEDEIFHKVLIICYESLTKKIKLFHVSLHLLIVL